MSRFCESLNPLFLDFEVLRTVAMKVAVFWGGDFFSLCGYVPTLGKNLRYKWRQLVRLKLRYVYTILHFVMSKNTVICIHYRVHKFPLLVPVLYQLLPVIAFKPVNFSPVLPSSRGFRSYLF
jgi:hypothetical protein